LNIYIKSHFSISSLVDDFNYLEHDVPFSDYAVIEPDYEELLDVRSMRRLSKILKMGVFSALRCLKKINSNELDGIITGTGLGCTADTLAFLENMISREEHLLTPTAFIQSTHNTLSGTLGIMLRNHGYNMTWSQRYFSFYKALEDGISRIRQNSGQQYLIVGADEMPDKVESIINGMSECADQVWTEGAASFIISKNGQVGDIKIIEASIKKTAGLKLDKYNTQNTFLVNANPTIENSITSLSGINISRLLGNIFVNDAIALAFACKLFVENKFDFNYNRVVCFGGDATNTSIIIIQKQQ